MKVEAYVKFAGEFMIPARCIDALAELVPLSSRYESGVGYTYSLSPTQVVDMALFSKDYVAGMIAADKLK